MHADCTRWWWWWWTCVPDSNYGELLVHALVTSVPQTIRGEGAVWPSSGILESGQEAYLDPARILHATLDKELDIPSSKFVGSFILGRVRVGRTRRRCRDPACIPEQVRHNPLVRVHWLWHHVSWGWGNIWRPQESWSHHWTSQMPWLIATAWAR